MVQTKVWPPRDQPPYELAFDQHNLRLLKADRALDTLVGGLIYLVPLGALVAIGAYGYEMRVRRPRLQLLELERKKDEIRQTLEFERLNRKDPNIGSEFGSYQIVKLLGEGGMARVYQAFPSATLDPNQAVAVKLMMDSKSASPEFRKRFFREADVGRNLSHPSVVRIEAYGEEGETLYLVMEYIEGRTLRNALRSRGLTGEQAWAYLQPILEGLTYVHDRGIVHRDLKPENIMVTRAQRVVIMDFGLARRHDHSMLTATGDILGTPAYMSPEQIQGLPNIDARSDQYAVGVMCYELLTGRLPFPDTTDPIQLLMKHISEPPIPARKLRSDISEELEKALLVMLAKDPESRYSNLAACQRILGPLVQALGSPA